MTKVLGLATLAENEGCIIVCDFQSVDPIVFLSVSNVPFPIPFPKTFLICFHSFHETCPNIAPAATSKFTVLVEILNSYEQLVLGSLKVALSMHSPQNSLISRTHETDLLSCQLDECQLPSPPPPPQNATKTSGRFCRPALRLRLRLRSCRRNHYNKRITLK